MFMVLCKNGCDTYLPANGNKPQLKSCGKPFCAYNAWKPLADKHGLGDFFEW